MIEVETIVVGAGPAGSTCAWELRRRGREVLVLDAAEFPRTKLCAGWLTPKVLRDLELAPETVPSLDLIPTFKIHWKHYSRHLEPPAGQYSVRRVEFDRFLLERSKADFEVYRVRSIQRTREGFTLDGRFKCRYLVGAGGTHCPVRRNVFGDLLQQQDLALAQELEFQPVNAIVQESHLWWRYPFSPGFAWYVPKQDAVNIGFGYFKKSQSSLPSPWDCFVGLLRREGLLSAEDQPKAKGWSYYLLENPKTTLKRDGAFLIGDAAGLATRDLGEGIGQAVESGKLCGEEISGGSPYRIDGITRYSMYGGKYLGRLLSPLY